MRFEFDWRALDWTEPEPPHPDSYQIRMFSPRAFLHLADPLFEHDPRRHRQVTMLYLRTAQVCAPLQLWQASRRCGVVAHEGRHRALESLRRGLGKVPVVVWKVPCPVPWA